MTAIDTRPVESFGNSIAAITSARGPAELVPTTVELLVALSEIHTIKVRSPRHDYAEPAHRTIRNLCESLWACVELAELDRPLAALPLARTALDQALISGLVMAGTSIHLTISAVNKSDAETRAAEFRARPEVRAATPHKNTITVIEEGPTHEGLRVRPYASLVTDYDGYTPNHVLSTLNDHSRAADEPARWAQRIHGDAFSNSALLAASERDELLTERECEHLAVHNAYLSRFVHGVAQTETSNHVYLCELIWQYANAIACLLVEPISTFLRGLEAESLALTRLSSLSAKCHAAGRHFWFPPRGPHGVDEYIATFEEIEPRPRSADELPFQYDQLERIDKMRNLIPSVQSRFHAKWH